MAHLDPELLSAYIDHELPAADMAAVERHLAECDACRTEYVELRGLSTLVRGLPVYLPKREIDVSAFPRGGSDTLAKVIAFSKPLAVAAIVLLIVFAGLRLLTDDDGGSDNGDQISFSAVQPTVEGTELDREASEEQAAEAPAAAPSDNDAFGEAMEPEATLPPALGAMPAMRSDTPAAIDAVEAETPAAMEPAAPAPTATPEPQADDDGNSWLPEAIVAVIVVLVAGAAGWYRLVRSPGHRRA